MKFLFVLVLLAQGLQALALGNLTDPNLENEYGTSGFHVDVASSPERIIAGQPSALRLALKDYRQNPIPWHDLIVHHARKLHVVVISETLDRMFHVHPEDFGSITEQMSSTGQYLVELTFPHPGRYAMAIDFVVEANNGPKERVYVSKYLNLTVHQGKHQVNRVPRPLPMTVIDTVRTHAIVDGGDNKFTQVVDFAELQKGALAKTVGYTLKLTVNEGMPVYAGQCARMTLEVLDLATGAPVEYLAPYLNAAFHVAISDASMSLRYMQHVHAMTPDLAAHMARVAPPGPRQANDLFPMDFCDDFYEHMSHDMPPKFGPLTVIYAHFLRPGPHVLFVQGKASPPDQERSDLLFARFVVDVKQYTVEVGTDPKTLKGGVETQLTFFLKDGAGTGFEMEPPSGKELYRHGRHHIDMTQDKNLIERNQVNRILHQPEEDQPNNTTLVHAMVVSEDFSYVGLVCAFAVPGFPGQYQVTTTFPRDGHYVISLTFTPKKLRMEIPPEFQEQVPHNMMEMHDMHNRSAHQMPGMVEEPTVLDSMADPPPYPFGVMTSVHVSGGHSVEKKFDGAMGKHTDQNSVADLDRIKSPIETWPAVIPGAPHNSTQVGNLNLGAPRHGKTRSFKDGFVNLKANNGQPIYAQVCTPLEFDFRQQHGGQIRDLEGYMNAGARVFISPRRLKDSTALETWAMPLTKQQPKNKLLPNNPLDVKPDVMDLDGAPEGTLEVLERYHEPCEAHHRYPRLSVNTSKFGPTLLAHATFNQTGTHVIIVQAFRGDKLVMARFQVEVCQSQRQLRWSQGTCTFAKKVEAGSSVLVPKGTHLILDESPPPLGSVVVEGTLEVDPASSGLSLKAGRVLVRAGGAFVLGSPQHPFRGRFNLHLLRNKTLGEGLASNPLLGDRLLALRGGRLQLYASMRHLPWGSIVGGGTAGSRTLILKVAPGWQRGDQVVLAPSGRHGVHEEGRVLAANGTRVQLEQALKHDHFDEIALLSRRVTITSDRSPNGGGRIVAHAQDVEESALQDLAENPSAPKHTKLEGGGGDHSTGGPKVISMDQPESRANTPAPQEGQPASANTKVTVQENEPSTSTASGDGAGSGEMDGAGAGAGADAGDGSSEGSAATPDGTTPEEAGDTPSGDGESEAAGEAGLGPESESAPEDVPPVEESQSGSEEGTPSGSGEGTPAGGGTSAEVVDTGGFEEETAASEEAPSSAESENSGSQEEATAGSEPGADSSGEENAESSEGESGGESNAGEDEGGPVKPEPQSAPASPVRRVHTRPTSHVASSSSSSSSSSLSSSASASGAGGARSVGARPARRFGGTPASTRSGTSQGLRTQPGFKPAASSAASSTTAHTSHARTSSGPARRRLHASYLADSLTPEDWAGGHHHQQGLDLGTIMGGGVGLLNLGAGSSEDVGDSHIGGGPEQGLRRGRKLLHSNAGAYWLKRDLDSMIIMAGDGQMGLYESKTRAQQEMRFAMYGVEVQGLGQFTSPKHTAAHAEIPKTRGALPGSIRLEKNSFHDLQGGCTSLFGDFIHVSLSNNVCYNAVDTGFGLFGAESAATPGVNLASNASKLPKGIVVHHNLAMSLRPFGANIPPHRTVSAAGFRVAYKTAYSQHLRLEGNAAVGVTGHGFLMAPSSENAASAHNVAHSNSGYGVIAGATAPACFRALSPTLQGELLAFNEAPPNGAAPTRTRSRLHVYSHNNTAGAMRSHSSGEKAASSDPEAGLVRHLILNGETVGPTGVTMEEGYEEAVRYFSFDVPPEAAFVSMNIEAVTGDIKVLLNPWSGLPCTGDLPDCFPNPAKMSKKYFSFGIQLKAPTFQPWRNPVYNVGRWYLGIVGKAETQFKVGVTATLCPDGHIGYLTDRRKFEYRCKPIQVLEPNQPAGEFHLDQSTRALHFYVDVPSFTSQVYFRVNKTGYEGNGILQTIGREGTVPTFQGVEGAAYGISGVVKSTMWLQEQRMPDGVYTSLRPVPPKSRFFLTVALMPQPKTTELGSVNITVLAGVDTCGPSLMGNPYFFPPHHEDDFFESARNRPSPVPCDLPVPFIKDSVELKMRQLKVNMGERFTLDSEYLYFDVPEEAHKATIYLSTTEEGVKVSGDVYVTHGNMPIQLDLEDYYMWQYEYRATFKDRNGALVRIELHAADLYGRRGPWFVGVDWTSKGSGQPYTLRVEYEKVDGTTLVPSTKNLVSTEVCR